MRDGIVAGAWLRELWRVAASVREGTPHGEEGGDTFGAACGNCAVEAVSATCTTVVTGNRIAASSTDCDTCSGA